MKVFKLAALALAMAATGIGWWHWDDWMIRPELRKSALTLAKDPDSAQFRNEAIYERHMCGELNLRNEYGGYTGYKRFISTKSMYSIEGDGKISINSEEPSTQDLIEELEWKTKQLKAGGAATEAEVNLWRFDRLWARHCGG